MAKVKRRCPWPRYRRHAQHVMRYVAGMSLGLHSGVRVKLFLPAYTNWRTPLERVPSAIITLDGPGPAGNSFTYGDAIKTICGSAPRFLHCQSCGGKLVAEMPNGELWRACAE